MRILSESTKMLDPKVVLTPKLIWNKIKWDKNKNEHTRFIVVRRTNAYVHLFFTIFNNSVANTMKDSLTTHFCSLNWLKQEIKDDLDFPGVMELGCWRWLNSLSAEKRSFSLSPDGVFIGVNLLETWSGSGHVPSIALSSGSDELSGWQRIKGKDVMGMNWS